MTEPLRRRYIAGGNGIPARHVLLALILILALCARLYEIDYNLDGDEIFSVNIAAGDFSGVVSGSLQDAVHPPLHNILLHFWVKAFGSSEISVRSMSVLFSFLFLLTAYLLFMRLDLGRLAPGLLAVLAFSPFFVYYGQQARPYALISFLSAANIYAFVRVLENPQHRGTVIPWVFSAALLLHSQYMGVVIIFMQLCIAFLYLQSGRLRILGFGIAGISSILPWLLAAVGHALFAGTDPLPQISWLGPPSLMELAWFFVSVFGESPDLQARWLMAAMAVPGLVYLKRFAAARRLPAGHALIFSIGFGVPVLVYALSVLGPKPVFAARQLMGASIAFVAAIGIFMSAMPRAMAALNAAVLFLFIGTSLPMGLPHDLKPPWRDMVKQMEEKHGALEVVAQETWIQAPLKYYRTSGEVRLWRDPSGAAGEKFLYACRPIGSRCSMIESGALKARGALSMEWNWGYDKVYNKIRLYEIRGAGD